MRTIFREKTITDSDGIRSGAGFGEFCASVEVPIFERLALNRQVGRVGSGYLPGERE
jgi:hypothetical protein